MGKVIKRSSADMCDEEELASCSRGGVSGVVGVEGDEWADCVMMVVMLTFGIIRG